MLSPQCFYDCQILVDSVNIMDFTVHNVTGHGKSKGAGGYRCGNCRYKNYDNHSVNLGYCILFVAAAPSSQLAYRTHHL